MKSTSTEIAFLLGAGAVKDAGLPTAVELTSKVEAVVESEYRSLLPAFRFLVGAIQFGRGCRGERPTAPVNIEEFISACVLVTTRDVQTVYPFVSAWHERIGTLCQLPQDIRTERACGSFEFLAKLCRERLSTWLSVDDSAKVKYLRSFSDFTRSKFKLRVFTLNYDDCIERALSDAVGKINEQWTTGFDENGWNPNLLVSDAYDVYLYKLHGSLDWVADAKLGVCSIRWPAAEDTEGVSADEEALLIFGTNSKMRPVDPFLSLLFHFQQALNRSTLLVIVGYSFGDEHVNEMIFDSLQRDVKMRCIVASPRTLQDLIPSNSNLARFVDLEKRFVPLRMGAREAFDSNALLRTTTRVLEELTEEEPF